MSLSVRYPTYLSKFVENPSNRSASREFLRLLWRRGREQEMSKALQASKIGEIRGILVAGGFATVREQTHALGLCRSTTWSVLQATHKNSGLSPAVINRMLDCPQLPTAVRHKILEYVGEKLSGRYGHSETQLHRFTRKLTFADAALSI